MLLSETQRTGSIRNSQTVASQDDGSGTKGNLLLPKEAGCNVLQGSLSFPVSISCFAAGVFGTVSAFEEYVASLCLQLFPSSEPSVTLQGLQPTFKKEISNKPTKVRAGRPNTLCGAATKERAPLRIPASSIGTVSGAA